MICTNVRRTISMTLVVFMILQAWCLQEVMTTQGIGGRFNYRWPEGVF